MSVINESLARAVVASHVCDGKMSPNAGRALLNSEPLDQQVFLVLLKSAYKNTIPLKDWMGG